MPEFFDNDKGHGRVPLVADAHLRAQAAVGKPLRQLAVQHKLGLADGAVQQLAGMPAHGARRPRPMALENASLAAKRVAR